MRDSAYQCGSGRLACRRPSPRFARTCDPGATSLGALGRGQVANGVVGQLTKTPAARGGGIGRRVRLRAVYVFRGHAAAGADRPAVERVVADLIRLRFEPGLRAFCDREE
jgi:hypothetical protein